MEQVVVAPNATFDYPCELHVSAPGPFEAGIRLQVFDTDIRQIELTIHGVGEALPKANNAKQSP